MGVRLINYIKLRENKYICLFLKIDKAIYL